MVFLPNHLYHVYNRTSQYFKLFDSRENMLFFLRKVRKEIYPYVRILAWCLMPSHYHFLFATPPNADENKIRNGIAVIQRSYTRAINKERKMTGSLFQIHAKSREIIALFNDANESNKVTEGLLVFNYIHYNVVRAGIVSDPADYEFSSFRDFAGLRYGDLCDIDLAEKIFGFSRGKDFVQLSKEIIPIELIRKN